MIVAIPRLAIFVFLGGSLTDFLYLIHAAVSLSSIYTHHTLN